MAKSHQQSLAEEYGRPEAPLAWYGLLVALFIITVGTILYLAVDQEVTLRQFSIVDMVLLAFATHKVAWLITKDIVTSFLRAPFTKFKHWSTPGAAIKESGRGSGFQLAFGELLSCPWCVGMYVAAAFVLSYLFYPDFTRVIAVIFNVLMLSDFFHIIFYKAGEWMSN